MIFHILVLKVDAIKYTNVQGEKPVATGRKIFVYPGWEGMAFIGLDKPIPVTRIQFSLVFFARSRKDCTNKGLFSLHRMGKKHPVQRGQHKTYLNVN